MSSLIFPKLPRSVARRLVAEFSELSVEQLGQIADVRHPAAELPPVGGSRVADSDLWLLRQKIIGIADGLGFPRGGNQESRREFDVLAAAILHATLAMRPRVAADSGVWSFICCIVLPDIVRWRYPDSGPRRYLGGQRNTLQRLWWRAAVLHDPEATEPYHLLRELPEDPLVQIFERPAVWADWSSARLIASRLVKMRKEVEERFNFQALVRRTLLEVRQLMPVVNLTALGPDAQRDLIDSVILSALSYRKVL